MLYVIIEGRKRRVYEERGKYYIFLTKKIKKDVSKKNLFEETNKPKKTPIKTELKRVMDENKILSDTLETLRNQLHEKEQECDSKIIDAFENSFDDNISPPPSPDLSPPSPPSLDTELSSSEINRQLALLKQEKESIAIAKEKCYIRLSEMEEEIGNLRAEVERQKDDHTIRRKMDDMIEEQERIRNAQTKYYTERTNALEARITALSEELQNQRRDKESYMLKDSENQRESERLKDESKQIKEESEKQLKEYVGYMTELKEVKDERDKLLSDLDRERTVNVSKFTELEEKDANIADLTARIDELRKALSEKVGCEELTYQIEELRDTLEAVTKKAENLQSELGSCIKKSFADSENLENTISQLEKQFEEENKAIREELDKCNSTLSEKKLEHIDEIRILEESVRELTDQVKECRSTCSVSNQAGGDACADVSLKLKETSEESKACDSNLVKCRTDESQLTTDYNELFGEYEEVVKKNIELERQVAEMSSSLEKFRKEQELDKTKDKVLDDLFKAIDELDEISKQPFMKVVQKHSHSDDEDSDAE